MNAISLVVVVLKCLIKVNKANVEVGEVAKQANLEGAHIFLGYVLSL